MLGMGIGWGYGDRDGGLGVVFCDYMYTEYGAVHLNNSNCLFRIALHKTCSVLHKYSMH